jgi:hypothetical protein
MSQSDLESNRRLVESFYAAFEIREGRVAVFREYPAGVER